MKLVHFYKTTRLNVGAENEAFITMYCFGWELKICGKTAKMITIITPSGETIITENADLIQVQ